GGSGDDGGTGGAHGQLLGDDWRNVLIVVHVLRRGHPGPPDDHSLGRTATQRGSVGSIHPRRRASTQIPPPMSTATKEDSASGTTRCMSTREDPPTKAAVA